jgi:transcriptional regulator with XRE-family HTH domain
MASSPQIYYGILAILYAMASLTERFGTRVKKLRTQKKMSQLELAQKSQLDLTTINEIENGNREPMLKTVWRIANALEIKMSDLFDSLQ